MLTRAMVGLLDRLILIACVLVAAALPSFAAQYTQRIGGQLEQVNEDIAPFQRIADRNHGGDLGALIRHYRNNDDASVRETGDAVAQIQQAQIRLTASNAAMTGTVFERAQHLALDAKRSTLRATWDNFAPGFSFAFDALVFAVGLGLLLWLLIRATGHGCVACARGLNNAGHRLKHG